MGSSFGKEKSVSLQEVATTCGVSRRTVAAVLSEKPRDTPGSARFSEITRKKVEESAKRLGYRPNRTWKNAVRGRHGKIGVLARDLASLPGSGNIRNIVRTAANADRLVTIELIDPDQERLPLFVRENVVDGLLVFDDLSESCRKAIRDYSIPCIHINADVRDCGTGIHLNEKGAMRQAATCFAEEGRKQIALILHGEDLYNVQRRDGLRVACAQIGLASPLVLLLDQIPGARVIERVRNPLFKFFREHPDVDAVLMHQPAFAQHVFNALATAGRSIPKDVSLIGLHNRPFNHVDPLLSTFETLREQTAYATEILCELIDGKRDPDEQIDLEYRLIHRGTTQFIPE